MSHVSTLAEAKMNRMSQDDERADEWAEEWSGPDTLQAIAREVTTIIIAATAPNVGDNQTELRYVLRQFFAGFPPDGIAAVAAGLDIAPTLDDFLATYDGANDDRRDAARDDAHLDGRE